MLRQDGRISMRALAARLHISRAGDYLRVQRLENAGVITRCSAWVDPRRYGVRPVRVRALEDHRSLATSYLFSAAFEPAGTPPIAPSDT